MRKYRCLVIVLMIAVPCVAQSWQDTVALIEKSMSRYQPQNPGCQLSISRNGEIIFSKAWGMAELEHAIPLTSNNVTEAGSVSKQFTAAAILLLEQQGKLSLNDEVRKYVPELPDYGTPIKLEQLMHHTSGLRDWGAIAALTGWPRSTKAYSNQDALEIIAQQKELNNIPGAEYIYSNSGYNLFAIIVERVSGLSLAEFTKKNIFIPAGMMHTQWRDNHNRVVPGRAIAYALTGNGYETDMPNEDVYGNGGLLTTTEDLLKWNQYYQAGKFGNPSLLPKQLAAVSFNNGLMNNYGAGLFLNKTAGIDYIGHSGSTASYRANLDYIPSSKLAIAFLSNTSQFDTSGINIPATIRNIFINNSTSPAAPVKGAAVMVTPGILKQFTGWYRNNRNGSGIQVTLKDSSLVMDKNAVLTTVEKNIFISNSNRIIFDKNGLTYIIPGRDSVGFLKVDSAKRSVDLLKAYTGKYYSEETRSFITVSLKHDSLNIHMKPGLDFLLQATYKDAFNIPGLGGNLYFERNKNNQCEKMKISISRARNVEFRKVE
jgi:CubicO group peptidase (beta-lactamase class C family)